MNVLHKYQCVPALIALCLWATSAWSENPSPSPSPTPEFDCVAVFDFMAGLAAPICPHSNEKEARAHEINLAAGLLVEHNFLSPSALDEISIVFCPLTYGLGIVPKPNTIYIDDALQSGSVDTLAEVLLHEFEHVKQMRAAGSTAFKCAYITDLLACGGCMDKNHAMEAPAYAAQARVRDFLLQRWLKDSR